MTTTYTYAQGGRVVTVTAPDGSTTITTKYLDGRIKSITGTAVTPQYYDYGIEQNGTQWTKVTTGHQGSPAWTKTYTDFLGRTFKTEKPGFNGELVVTENFYNNKGQLVKTTQTGQADMLYVYDELGDVEWSGLDVDGNGVLEVASVDRVTKHSSQYVSDGTDWWKESRQTVYAHDNDGTPTETQITRTRLTGLGNGLVAENVSENVHGKVTTSVTTIDRENHTQTRTVDYPDSEANAVEVSQYGLTTSSTTKDNLTLTYGYDSLGRRTSVTDPRTGTSTTVYDDKGRVESIQDAEGNQTTLHYDDMTGHKIAEENGLGHLTRYAYNNRGQVVRQWGDATYPVEFVYDDYGRKIKMHTFRDQGQRK